MAGVANTMREVLAGVGEHLMDRIEAIPAEVGKSLGNMGRLGSWELGSAIFNGTAYRGDLGLLTNSPTHTMREVLEQDAQQHGQDLAGQAQEHGQEQSMDLDRGRGR